MHIAQICQRFYVGRGQEIHVYNLSQELAKRDHQITIYTSNIESSDIFKKEIALHPNVKIKICKGINLSYPSNQVLFPDLGQQLFEDKTIDIIHAHGAMCYSSLTALTIAKTRKIPFVFTPHFHPWKFFSQTPYRYLRRAYEISMTVPIIKHSSKVIAVSPFEKSYLVNRRNVDPNKIIIIANGINMYYYPTQISRRAVRKQYNIPEKKRYIITFGNIEDARKGIDRSLKIFNIINKKIPNTHLIIAGWIYRKNRDYLSKLLDTLPCKENVSTLGYVAENEKIALIKMSEILISPTSYEAFGIVLGEAMILGVPVVVTNVGGTPYIVRHGKTGFTVGNYNGINKFAEYSLQLLNNEELRIKMGKAGKEIVRSYFTWKKISKKVENVYLNLLKDKK